MSDTITLKENDFTALVERIYKEAKKKVPGCVTEKARAFFSDGTTGNVQSTIRTYEDFIEKVFGSNRTNDGFSDFREFKRAIDLGKYDERMKQLTRSVEKASGGDGETGGYLIPTQYIPELFLVPWENGIVLPRAHIYPMKTKNLQVPAMIVDEVLDNLYGIQAEWLAEGGTGTVQDPKHRLMELVARKLACFGRATNELVEDSNNLYEQNLQTAFSASINVELDKAFLRGSGVGQPLGILNAPCMIECPKEPEQAADTIVYENLTNMLSHLHPACFSRSVWVAHITAIPQLLSLSVTGGISQQFIPVLNESNGTFRMLSRPVVFTEKLESLGNCGDVLLGDFSQYAVGMRREITLEKSNAPSWQTDKSDYRAIVRVDGQPLWDKAKVIEGGELSPFIVLEGR